MKRLLALTVVTILGLSTTSNASQIAPCNLTKASSLAQARIQATCVKANVVAKEISGDYGVSTHLVVHSNACEVRRPDLAVCDFTITTMKTRRNASMTCSGDVSVRGKSRYPRLLKVRLRGPASCV